MNDNYLSRGKQYLSRGKRICGGEWVHGSPVHDESGYHYIITEKMSEITCCSDCGMSDMTYYEIDPSTLGRCTGLPDRNGKLFYEGDICRDIDGGIAQIVWDEKKGSWGATYINYPDLIIQIYAFAYEGGVVEIIGNIHDNPDCEYYFKESPGSCPGRAWREETK